MLQQGKLNFLIGCNFGSCGKGNVSDYIAQNFDYQIAISNNSPNAGHQFKLKDGSVETAKMLPVAGICKPHCQIFLGAGSVVDTNRTLEEIERYNLINRTFISPSAAVVNEYCKEYEREHLKYIASTFQGSGAALGLKAMRSQMIKIARDCQEISKFVVNYNMTDEIMKAVDDGGTAVVEICQGYGLSVDSEFYPYCTSRPVNVGQSLAYLDMPTRMVGDVIGVARSYIIRVGNVEGGTSGNTMDDSREITWEELSEKLGKKTIEMTTVTNRVRRVFTFSKKLLSQAIRRNGINILFLTFVDYLNDEEKEAMRVYLLNEFNLKEVYFVSGFGDFDNTVKRIK